MRARVRRSGRARRGASLERYSKHPLAGAILELARQRGSALSEVSRVSERPGEGLRGNTNGREVGITSRNRASVEDLRLPPIEAGLECLVFLIECSPVCRRWNQ